MLATQSELDNFHRFASDAICKDQGTFSLAALFELWLDQHEQIETVASIRRGVAEADAGRLQNFSEVDRSIRQQLGFPQHER